MKYFAFLLSVRNRDVDYLFQTPRAENAKIDVKVIGASQEMCNYLPLLQKLPAALVIRKVKVTKHGSRVSLREIFT